MSRSFWYYILGVVDMLTLSLEYYLLLWAVGKRTMKVSYSWGVKYLLCLRLFNALHEVEGVVQRGKRAPFLLNGSLREFGAGVVL